jgi:hypothetical protein
VGIGVVRRLLLLALLAVLTCVLFASSAVSNTGTRKPGSYPKPAEYCTHRIRGTVKWVKDVQLDAWVRWRCICHSDGRCHWRREYIQRESPYRSYIRPDPTGWHRHLHLIVLPMASGGWCGYWWPTWHYVPARLR